MRHIDSKADFYKMSRSLLLGNRLRQLTWEEFAVHFSSMPEIVGVRHTRTAFAKGSNSCLMKRRDACSYGLRAGDKRDLLFDEAAPHDRLTIQGEAAATEQGLYVRYSTLQCHQRVLWEMDRLMRHVVVSHVFGLQASQLLQKFMDARSWEMLNEILGCQRREENTRGDRVLNFAYPVVEFSCFSCPVGLLGWNTLFWEVRTKY